MSSEMEKSYNIFTCIKSLREKGNGPQVVSIIEFPETVALD